MPKSNLVLYQHTYLISMILCLVERRGAACAVAPRLRLVEWWGAACAVAPRLPPSRTYDASSANVTLKPTTRSSDIVNPTITSPQLQTPSEWYRRTWFCCCTSWILYNSRSPISSKVCRTASSRCKLHPAPGTLSCTGTYLGTPVIPGQKFPVGPACHLRWRAAALLQ